jgi:galactokinase
LFLEQFGKAPRLYSSPGRINLIGEHTDYNEGFVLPGAVDKKIYVGIAENGMDVLRVFARQYGERFIFELGDIRPIKGWATYLLGMLEQFRGKGYELKGLDLVVDGDVPLGAGMSSSAALCSAFGFALNDYFGWKESRMSLALMGQQTEHQFAGVKCGIMDEFTSLHGKRGHLIKLDCRSMDYEYIPFDFPGYQIVLVNTMVSHELASSEYNLRRQQCEEGVDALRRFFPEIRSNIRSLRDLNLKQLESHRDELEETVYKRCFYVIGENARLQRGCQFLRQGDLSSFGKLMFLSHEGLRRDYAVSCEESDFLVDASAELEGVMGSRQMGGGFGGCTIHIVRSESIPGFLSEIPGLYEKKFGIIPPAYIVSLEDGARKED